MKWGEAGSSAEFIAELDAWTKQGRRFAVLKELERVLRARPPSEFLHQLARLANRNHAYVLALRILHPLIRDDREKIHRASPEVLTISATSLMWLGALEEADQQLERVQGFTEALLTRVFVRFAQWDYERSIPILLRYVNSADISDYQRLVGKVNLLAAFISVGRKDAARKMLQALKPALASQPTKILYGNCLELESQILIQEERFDQALRVLKESEEAFRDQPGRYLLYVRKWKAVVQLTLNPSSAEARSDLLRIKNEALELRNWETIRDCDFHLARLTGQNELLDRLLLGTPYRGFHDRVRSLFGIEKPKCSELSYCPQQVELSPRAIGLDLPRLAWKDFFNPTSWPLIQTVTRDIYRPPRVGVVFSSLYPGEYFNPFTSPQRVRNSVFRFNDWAKERSPGFRIVNEQGDYFLKGPDGIGVSRKTSQRNVSRREAALRIFRRSNGPKSFTAASLSESLGISHRSALLVLQDALAHGWVERFGRGKNTRYILSSGRRRRAAA